jgi:hypothetical protein
VRRAQLVPILLLAALACRPEEPPAQPAPPPARRAAARAPARVEAKEPRVVVRRQADGTFRVVARGAPRFHVLQELARAAGLVTRPGAGRVASRRLELDLDGVSLEAALGAILGDVAHTLHYEPAGAGSAEVSLRAVTVGAPVPPPIARASAPVGEPGAAGARRSARPERSERPPDTSELAELTERLARDPSAEARAQAADALAAVEGGEDAFRAADALLEALRDSDPGVVVAAVQALEDLHDVLPDPRIRRAVAALARHPDPHVREAVSSFREWTEEP